jgi:signal transduction histidine kinase
MNIYRKKVIWKYLLLFFAVAIGLSSLFYTQSLINILRNDEKERIELWAEAQWRLVNVSVNSEDFGFLFSVIENNKTVPVILTDDHDKIISTRNLPDKITLDSLLIHRELKKMKMENSPIIIDIGNNSHNYIYYRESIILRKLAVYPYIQLGVILLFITIAYIAFSTSREAEQNQVWVGLTKETAHQLGTPVTSLSAWADLFESRYPGNEEVKDLSADVDRLARVTERFSLIGSKPKLHETDIKGLLINVIAYLEKRTSSSVIFRIASDNNSSYYAPANDLLLSWVFENVIKNAIDAMKGEGIIVLRLRDETKSLIIDIEDNGKGILKKDFKNIFKPGFSTRERGWGLGLSLSKRIIEEYHKGKIFVEYSEPGKGTCMRVILKK